MARTIPTDNYIVTEGKPSRIFLPDETTCPTFITSGSINSCTVKNNGMIVEVTVTGNAEIPGLKTYTISAAPTGETEIYKMLMNSIGMNISPSNYLIHSLEENNKDEIKYAGVLQDIRDLLGPKYLGGVFWDQTCSPSSPMPAAIERSILISDDGVPTTFRVTLSNSNKTLPARLSTTGFLTPLHRKLKVERFLNAPSGFKTEQVVDFACDSINDLVTGAIQMGRAESTWEDKVSSTVTETEKRLTFWNTNFGGMGQIEMFSTEKKVGSGQVIRLHNRYMRASQFTSQKFKINELEYNSEGSAGLYKEDLRSQELDGENDPGVKTTLTRRELASLHKQNSTAPGQMFDGVSFQKKRSTIFYNAGTSNSNLRGQVIRRNNHVFQIGYHQDSSTLKFSVKNELSGVEVSQDLNQSSVTKISMAVSAGGNYAVGYALKGSMVYYVTWKIGDSTFNWSTFGSMINFADAAVLDSGDYIFLTVDNSGIVYQSQGVVGLAAPSTEAQLTNYNSGGEIYTQVVLTSSATSFHNFIVGENGGQQFLYYCEMSASDTDCEKTTAVDSLSSINEIEPFYNASISKLYVNYKAPSTYKMAYTTAPGTFTTTTETGYSFQSGLAENSIDSSTGYSVTPLHVYGEYYKSFPNYDMNLNVLKPDTFNSYFTGFEN